MKAKIVHISDLHLRVNKERVCNVDVSLRNSALEKIFSEEPEAIVMSGDAVDGFKREDFIIALGFSERIRKRFPLLVIPGNLDYARIVYNEEEIAPIPKDSEVKEEPLKIKKINLFETPIEVAITSKSNYKEIMKLIKIEGVYYNFTQELTDTGLHYIEDYSYYSQTIGEQEPTLKLLGFNLIGFNSCRDISPLLIGEAETNLPGTKIYLSHLKDGAITKEHLEERLRNLPEGLNIAVNHHPLFFIPGANPYYGHFYKGEEVAKGLLEKGIQISLSGHKHLQGYVTREIQVNGNKKPFHVCNASSLFSKDIKKPYKDNSYNILTIEDNKATLEYQELNTEKREVLGKFDIDL